MGLILAGVVLRVAHYLANRSLWFDEAMLANNVRARDFVGLAHKLDYQGAPLGFLYVEKLLCIGWGYHEYALRLYSLVAGCLALLLMYRMAFRLLRGPGALLALGLFAFGGPLIYYSAEAKPYGGDALWALALGLLAGEYVEHRNKPLSLGWLVFAGCLSSWFSFQSAFVLASIGLALADRYRVRGERQRWPGWCAVMAAWGANLVLVYLISIRPIASNPLFKDTHEASYLPFNAGAWDWLAANLVDLVGNTAGIPYPLFAMVLLGVGMLALRRPWRIILYLPLLFALFASGFKAFVFVKRLLLFLVPAICLGVGAGSERVASWCGDRRPVARWLWLVGLPVFWFPPARAAWDELRHPTMGEDIKPVLAYLNAHRRPQDRVFIYDGAVPAYTWYASNDANVVMGHWSADPQEYLAPFKAWKGEPRVWALFTHPWNLPPADEEINVVHHTARLQPYRKSHPVVTNGESFIVSNLSGMARLDDVYRADGASVYLFDLR